MNGKQNKERERERDVKLNKNTTKKQKK